MERRERVLTLRGIYDIFVLFGIGRKQNHAGVAQSVEQLIRNEKVKTTPKARRAMCRKGRWRSRTRRKPRNGVYLGFISIATGNN